MAHYDFYAKKKVTSVGAWINRSAVRRLARLCMNAGNFSTSAKKSVIEIGPGKGAFAECLIASQTADYKGYEADELLYSDLKNLGLNVVKAAAPPISEPSETSDCIVLNNVLEHMSDLKMAEALINETSRVLKKNGTLFIVVPNFLDWGRDFFNLDYTHQFITTEVRCRQLLEDCGFRVKSVRYHYGCFFSDFGRLFNACARMCRAALTIALPRKISRSGTIQKLGVLFAENIICIAEKQ